MNVGGIIVGALVASLLPIWRPAAGWQGLNMWEFAMTTVFVEHLEHVPVAEAIENARRAYCEVMGLDYYQSYQEPHASRIALLPEIFFAGVGLMSLPLWRSGLIDGITGWEWAYHHTVMGPEVTHIPEEDYKASFTKRYKLV